MFTCALFVFSFFHIFVSFVLLVFAVGEKREGFFLQMVLSVVFLGISNIISKCLGNFFEN